MNDRQTGYLSRQTLLLLALLGLVLAFAVPQLKEFSDRSKVSEALHLASESKVRLAEFYLMSDRFPSTETELKNVTTSVFRQPGFVSAVVVDSLDEDFDIVVKVFLKEDVIDNDGDEAQYVYMAASKSITPGHGLEWSCGASGVDADLLPHDCTS